VASIVRGLAGGRDDDQRFVLEFRGGRAVRRFVDGRQVARYACQGPATPDHVLRIKAKPLVLPRPAAGDLDPFAVTARQAAAAYAADYKRTFARFNRRHGGAKAMPDPWARIVLVPGVGLYAFGRSPKDAAIAADLAEANVAVIGAAEALAPFQSLPARDLFEVETWGPEQAKLARSLPHLAGHVVAVTGGASGIGAATARAFAAQGASVAVLDIDGRAAARVANETGGLAVECDVTDRAAVSHAMGAIRKTFGGLDILVSNAGAAWQGPIGEVPDGDLRKSFELNFWGHQNIAQAAVGIMKAQGLGGCLLFNTSKQAVNPGPGLGPYGVPKAATLFLMRQYALDHGSDGIRSNAVNADRVRSGLLTDAMIDSRADARRVSRDDYMTGNLLGREVTAEDVADAFVALAQAPKTTAAVITVDGGNIAAALR
jgi:NAD(P)-dependent dehydrogenase (short-subunit alcohol dehydrogenase family)